MLSPSAKSGGSPQVKLSELPHVKMGRAAAGPKTQVKEGDVFRYLTVVSRHPSKSYSWICRCVCGVLKTIRKDSLYRGATLSCGCRKGEMVSKRLTRHGCSKSTKSTKSREYTTWECIKARCLNENNHSYHRYGGRGITICDRWKDSFESFLADMGARPSGHSIDRINNDGNYEPGNCKWSTRQEQQGNRCTSHLITWQGETHCAAWWERKLGMKPTNLTSRLYNGWTLERAITTP